MFGPPCIIPPGSIAPRQVWTHVIKNFGKSKSRNTCDGYPLIKYAKTYADCSSKHGFNIFIALYTYLRYIIMEADDINAYAQAPTPHNPL